MGVDHYSSILQCTAEVTKAGGQICMAKYSKAPRLLNLLRKAYRKPSNGIAADPAAGCRSD